MGWPTSPDRLFNAVFGTQGRVALITGGVSGIGLATAELFVAAGMKVFVLDVNEAAGDSAVNRISALSHSGSIEFRKLDVTSADQVIEVVDGIAAVTGRIDILFNCAGISRRDADMDEEARQLLWNVNVLGTENVSNAVLPHMKRGQFGRIVNMGSVVGYSHVSFELGKLYKASKEKVHKYTLELALQVATDGITVVALAPGRVLTELVTKPGSGWVAKAPDTVEAFRNGCATQASGTMLLPEEVAFRALSLCSPLARHESGSIVDLSDGWGTAGHKPWAKEQMPAAYLPFCRLAQETTPTPVVPTST